MGGDNSKENEDAIAKIRAFQNANEANGAMTEHQMGRMYTN